MSYALIDNATITAAQRLLGDIKVRSNDTVDTDISALENLIQAILFYDEVICIDDYKIEHKDERRKKFNFIRFLDPEAFNLNKISEEANKETQKFHPIIRGGEFADEDFKNFFDLLKMNIICTWNMNSSVYYLTLKMLGEEGSNEFEKYGKLSASIFNELLDQNDVRASRKYDVTLYDSRGRLIDFNEGYNIPGAKWGNGETGGLTPALASFVASLNWITYRTIYYSFCAKHLKADTFLYPIRQAFQLRYMEKTGSYDMDFSRFLIEKLAQRATKEAEAIFNINKPMLLKVQLPFFVAWLINETGDIAYVIPAALELRNNPKFVLVKEQLKEIQNLCESDDYVEARRKSVKVQEDLEKCITSIRKDYGLKVPQGIPLAPLIKVFNFLTSFAGWPAIPEFDKKIPVPEFMNDVFNKKGINLLYRDITHDLSIIPQMGQIRDKLEARVVVDKKARSYTPKAELPQYRYNHSQVKSPM